MLILLLTFVRVALRLMYKAPPEPPMPQWQAWAAKALHFGFYLVMIGMPLTGWLMVSTSVRPIPMLGAVPFAWNGLTCRCLRPMKPTKPLKPSTS